MKKTLFLILLTCIFSFPNSYGMSDDNLHDLAPKREEIPSSLKTIEESDATKIKDTFTNVKDVIKEELIGAEFKIDGSIVYMDHKYLPLLPEIENNSENLKIEHVVHDKECPKLFLLSNGWAYVKVLKNKNGDTGILKIDEVPEKYRDNFKKLRFPSDLLVPKNFEIDKELENVYENLKDISEKTSPIETNLNTQASRLDKLGLIIEAQEQRFKERESDENKLNDDKISITKIKPDDKNSKGPKIGNLYLTSPDTGKIIHIDFSNPTDIRQVQLKGLPLNLKYNELDKNLYINDLAKGKIYKLNTLGNKFPDKLEIPNCNKPSDLEISNDGEKLYILNSPKYYLLIYDLKTKETNKIKIDFEPNSLSIIDNKIAITSPNNNKIIFIDLNTFEVSGILKIDGSPTKIISDDKNKLFYVTCRTSNKVVVVNPETQTIETEIEVESTPTSLALNPKFGLLYVGNGKSDTISIINTIDKKIINSIKLPIDTQFPSDLIVTNDGNWLIVTSESTSTISIIDTSKNQVSKKIDLNATTHKGCFI